MTESIENNSLSRAKNYYYFLTLFFLFAQVLYFIEDEVIWPEDVIGGIVFSSVILIFTYFTIKGYPWAKWILTALLVLVGGAYVFAGIAIPSLKMMTVGLYQLFFGIIPHFSKLLKPIFSLRPKVRIEENKYEYPLLIKRYKAMLIDTSLILVFILFTARINAMLGAESIWLTVPFILIILFYEPFLTAYSSTIGQRLMKIRVRNVHDPDCRINLGWAFVRFVTKGLLGWLSFLTISFNKEKRAIHDMAASSIMIEVLE